jgi:hypothetical protein
MRYFNAVIKLNFLVNCSKAKKCQLIAVHNLLLLISDIQLTPFTGLLVTAVSKISKHF